MPHQKKDFILNPLIITIILIIALIAAFHFYQNIEKINQLEKEIQKTESEITAAKVETKELQQHLEASNNHDYIEEVAREKLGLVKTGEKLLIPVEEKKDAKDLDDKNK